MIRGDSTKSDIVILHAFPISGSSKTHCTPACSFTCHVEKQCVAVVCPLQSKIAITGFKASVVGGIHPYNYISKQSEQKSSRYLSRHLHRMIDCASTEGEVFCDW